MKRKPKAIAKRRAAERPPTLASVRSRLYVLTRRVDRLLELEGPMLSVGRELATHEARIETSERTTRDAIEIMRALLNGFQGRLEALEAGTGKLDLRVESLERQAFRAMADPTMIALEGGPFPIAEAVRALREVLDDDRVVAYLEAQGCTPEYAQRLVYGLTYEKLIDTPFR